MYGSIQELAEILAQPNLRTAAGRRDAVLLSILYDTGARVQELIDLSVGDVRLDPRAGGDSGAAKSSNRSRAKGRRLVEYPLRYRSTRSGIDRSFCRRCTARSKSWRRFWRSQIFEPQQGEGTPSC